MKLTYNGMYRDYLENNYTSIDDARIGVPQNTVRCPECGSHTIYINGYEEEWCLNCEYGHWEGK